MPVLKKVVMRSVSNGGGTLVRSVVSILLRCWSGRITLTSLVLLRLLDVRHAYVLHS